MWLFVPVDRRRGPPDRHVDEQVHRILEEGASHWDWGQCPEPSVRVLADGTATGVDFDTYAEELHLLGNGVVPQQAAAAFALLWHRLHGTTLADDPDLATGRVDMIPYPTPSTTTQGDDDT
jgi:hypothetical protein